jgi:hypothetical protein
MKEVSARGVFEATFTPFGQGGSEGACYDDLPPDDQYYGASKGWDLSRGT